MYYAPSLRGHDSSFYGRGNRINPNSPCERSEAIFIVHSVIASDCKERGNRSYGFGNKSVLLNIPLKTVKAIASSLHFVPFLAMTWWNRDCFVGKKSLPPRNDVVGVGLLRRHKTKTPPRNDRLRTDINKIINVPLCKVQTTAIC